MAGEHRERPNLGQGRGYLNGDVQLEQLCYASSNCAWRTLCGKARWWRLFLLAVCAADEEQRKAQREEFAKAAAEAEAQIAQQDHARCLSYGKPGSAAYIDCRSSLKNDRADMKK
jgi:glutathione S-transferase